MPYVHGPADVLEGQHCDQREHPDGERDERGQAHCGGAESSWRRGDVEDVSGTIQRLAEAKADDHAEHAEEQSGVAG